ncbi:hypothetical protein OF83DRAFT_219462 [Amylostereum chailletii]|nr:hypothetical protein OF83DRAFT_219462 [Amylostereum chailletii]
MVASPMPSSSSLSDLHTDILLLIIEHLSGHVTQFSTVSKCIRIVCSNRLFRKCTINCMGPYPPSSVLPYIQTLVLRGAVSFEDRFSYLELAVLQMASLHTVRIIESPEGVAWSTLQTVLSSRSLRMLEIIYSPWLKTLAPSRGHTTKFFSPLCKFAYVVDPWHECSDMESVNPRLERQFLELIMSRVRNTVECLQLPVDVALLQHIATTPYKSLQDIALSGYYYDQEKDPTLLLRTLCNVPRLKSLDLKLIQRDGSGRTVVWPQGTFYSATFDYLERISISYPDPADEIYSRLPSSVQHLSLLDWPRHYL